MAMTPEAKVKAVVTNTLKQMKAYIVKPMGVGYGNSGVPELIVCVRGRFIGIECKAKGGKTTALQLHNLNSIDMAGGVALVINENNMHDLEQLIEEQMK